ncbi:hypothetical protein AURDEDRAFT_115526 [Auricularia subglabra TFB-10046 SS5]|nr:hypothetical protein AURDEDRAFT_115526 [Auricularia subglabra TFB-10046 SS5]
MSRPVLSHRRRPSSAIFIGSTGSGPPELPSPPSPVSSNDELPGLNGGSRVAHLPSPPHTNSTGSKSSTGSGSVRMPDNSAHRRSFMGSEDDDDEHERDEDDTARLSDDRRKSENEPERSVQRVKSLTERNRQVLDKIASISSGSRLAAASPTTRAQPSPSATPFPSATINNRVSFTRSRREVDFSGSETEREGHDRTRSAPEDLADARRYSATSSDDRSITPPSSSSRRSGEYESSSSRRSGEYESSSSRRSGEYESSNSRRSGEYESSGSREYRSQRARLISAPSPAASPKRPQHRSLASSAATFNTPASPRSRRLSVSEQYVEEEEEPISITLNRGSSSKKRQPLPREFTTSGSVRRSLDGRTSGFPPETPSRPRSPEAYVGRGSPSPTGSPATFGAPNERSPRVQKPGRAATLRENGHSYTASPLSPHRDRRTARWSLSSDLSARLAEEPDLTTSSRSSRHRPQASEGGIGNRSSLRSPADPDDVFGRGGRSTTRSIQGVLSRPSTSMGGDEAHQTGRRSRTALSPAPPRAGSGFQSPGATMRISQQPTSEHAKLMMDALNMFESQLARFTSTATPVSAGGATPTGSGTAPQVHDLLRNAATLAQSAQALNTLLRGATARALESQIDAEVGESPTMVDAGEVWRRVGGEYRECLRASDDVVRGVTGVLLGVGRVVRESSSGHLRTGSDDGSAGMSGRRTAEGIRPSTSMSAVRPRDREREFDDLRDRRRTEEFVPPPSATKERASAATLGPRSASRLERRRGGSLEQVEASPTPTPTPANSSNSSRSSDFHASAHARTLPPISIPPPTPTLPSETLLRRKASTPATSKPRTPANNRLSMASGSSAATIRAAAPASAVVTTTTVTSPIGEPGGSSRRGALASASFFSTAGRARGASITLSGLQERDAARKRTISATDRDPDAARAAAATIASRQREREPIPPVPARPRTERRRTVTEMFS